MSDRLLICTDLDRTLIPNGPQSESEGVRQRFARFCSRPEVELVYVTGRHRALIEQAISNYCLPVPDYAIADVGTTIYRVGRSRAWERETAWDNEIAADWNGRGHAEIKAMLSDLQPLRLQENTKQNQHKLSYYVPMHSDRGGLSATIKQRLDANNVAARLIWSDDEPAGVGLLDVTPQRASKYHAIKALMRTLAIDETKTVFAGDSGNDLEVLSSAIPAVLVANGQQQIRDQATRQAALLGHIDQLYIAKGDFNGMNGNYAAGILEGIAHYHPDKIEAMDLVAGPDDE
jgi:HAD superfamily hydrolase (TIGR01484 family)